MGITLERSISHRSIHRFDMSLHHYLRTKSVQESGNGWIISTPGEKELSYIAVDVSGPTQRRVVVIGTEECETHIIFYHGDTVKKELIINYLKAERQLHQVVDYLVKGTLQS